MLEPTGLDSSAPPPAVRPRTRQRVRHLTRFARLPFYVQLLALASLAAALPAVHALTGGRGGTAAVFGAAALLGLGLSVLIGLASVTAPTSRSARGQLGTLVFAFGALPVLMAVPFAIAHGATTMPKAWFEMVSAFTTTGATVYDHPGRLDPSLHLWRATVGWLGGLLMWVTALAVMQPMNIGGFEVRYARGIRETDAGLDRFLRAADPRERLSRYTIRLAPIYAGLTAVLWLGLLITGEVPIVAICHAMSTIATSGISPIGGTTYGASGLAGEGLIALFLLFALSRATYSRGLLPDDKTRLIEDPEIRLALTLVGAVTAFLFLRHFLGAGEPMGQNDVRSALAALWGALFTTLSFLTTTGFESFWWFGATEWSGLPTPGLILVGLALVGGGVATTAGGVKLLRVYALSRHGQRELERLIHPHSIGGSSRESRRIRKQGARIAWIFFMLFAISIMVVMGLLALTGVQFETAMVLSVAALSTTGPLAEVAGEFPISYAGIPDSARAVLAGAMVLGRLELLALIALLDPQIWRS
ncbi:potassium transporter TrkG [Wenxinia saemankumensis]|uniref:Trk system potassium uptake protein TrkH n=1 Tax=Wenxinia saemankumensis TaxID=1447782 RepID=A0A1M6A6L9_9RHOB|nr:potassium transporter TrkG [Wenxinia saemankumensis]SHI32138.1 trk system potassium uptake protein TrkH [Wenxinia saemankumensis]